jgi:hypothetical protein
LAPASASSARRRRSTPISAANGTHGAPERSPRQEGLLDTDVFIYAVEEVQAYTAAVDALLGLIKEGMITACTSELTLAECLTKPFEEGRDNIVQACEES